MTAFPYKSEDVATCPSAGKYEATIETAETDISKAGYPMLVVTFGLLTEDGPATITEYISNPGSLGKLRRLALALGERVAFYKDEFDLNSHLGKTVLITVSVEDDQFGGSARIDAVVPVTRNGTTGTPPTDGCPV